MKTLKPWLIIAGIVLLAWLVLWLGPLRQRRPVRVPAQQETGTIESQLEQPATSPYAAKSGAVKVEGGEDPEAFPGAAALLKKSKQTVRARLGQSNKYQDLGYHNGRHLEKYIYYDVLYGAREVVINFENNLSIQLLASFVGYKDFSEEDAFSAIDVPFPKDPALRQEKYTADKRYYFWLNYSGYRKVEIAAKKDGEAYRLLYISVDK